MVGGKRRNQTCMEVWKKVKINSMVYSYLVSWIQMKPLHLSILDKLMRPSLFINGKGSISFTTLPDYVLGNLNGSNYENYGSAPFTIILINRLQLLQTSQHFALKMLSSINNRMWKMPSKNCRIPKHIFLCCTNINTLFLVGKNHWLL